MSTINSHPHGIESIIKWKAHKTIFILFRVPQYRVPYIAYALWSRHVLNVSYFRLYWLWTPLAFMCTYICMYLFVFSRPDAFALSSGNTHKGFRVDLIVEYFSLSRLPFSAAGKNRINNEWALRECRVQWAFRGARWCLWFLRSLNKECQSL